MKHDRNTMPIAERRGIGLATKILLVLALASAVILLTGALGWWLLHTLHEETKAVQQVAAGGNAAAMTSGLLIRIDETELVLAAGAFLGLVLLAGLYLYLIRAVVRPLQINARLMSRLAVGDSSDAIPERQLERNDEIGDLARALRDAIAYQREEVGIANDMSAGDFTGTVPVRDPADMLGMAIRRMAGVTIETLRRVNAHVGQVTAGGKAIVSASGELSANSADITAAVTEISTGITGLGTHAGDNANAAEQASRLANTGTHSVERGYEDVGEMGAVMLNMQACGDNIVRIAKSIGDIAFQTNLLALNAGVEAARAGRHGKGFTIVAEEVRGLAVRTSKAANETSTLMKETVEQVELAAAIAGRINATFAELQANIQETDALLAKIAAASREQSGGIDQISAALRQVDNSVRENTVHVGNVAEMADSLIGTTDRLRQTMGRFRLDFGRPPGSELFARPAAASSDVRVPRVIRRTDRE